MLRYRLYSILGICLHIYELSCKIHIFYDMKGLVSTHYWWFYWLEFGFGGY